MVANNNCAAAVGNGQSGPEHLSGEAHVHTASVSVSAIEPVSKVLVPGPGPIHACLHPSGRVAIGNYAGGTIDLVGPLEGGRLPDGVVSTVQVGNTTIPPSALGTTRTLCLGLCRHTPPVLRRSIGFAHPPLQLG